MDIVFATFVTDETWLKKFAQPLANSARFFHPDITFKIFIGEELEALIPKDYFLKTACLKAVVGSKLAEQYKHVVFFDADSIITARLTELLEEDYELAGVRTVADNGCIHSVSPQYNRDFQIPGVCTLWQYLNSGLVSSRVQGFWDEWVGLNKLMSNNLFDQDQGTFNRIFYAGRYKTKMLDPPEVPYHYGISSAGDTTMSWDSWKGIYRDGNSLFIDSLSRVKKQIKVLHLTGNQELGDGIAKPPPGYKSFNNNIFTQEVQAFLEEITG